MPSTAVALSSKVAGILITFAGMILVAAIIALFAARKWGGQSRYKRRAIYSIVGVVGIVIAGFITHYRLRQLA